MSMWGNKKWGDVDEDDTEVPKMEGVIETKYETNEKGQQIKTVVEIRKKDESKGQKKTVKVTRKFLISEETKRVSKDVANRRKEWKKFGACEGKPDGIEPNITVADFDTITMNMKPKSKEDAMEEEAKKVKEKMLGGVGPLVCRICGGTDHWTIRCPERDRLRPKSKAGDAPTTGDVRAGEASSSTGKYVPRHLREGADRGRAGPTMQRDDTAGIRVTNLSEETTDEDVQALFRPFGRTSRIFLAKDRVTGLSRGFAFINYYNRSDAQSAIDRLNGHGYGNLILHVEWAKPRDDSAKSSGERTQQILASQKRRF